MEAKPQTADFTAASQQQLLILRLPDDLANRIRYLIKEAGKPESSLPSVIDVRPKDPSNPSNDFIFCLENNEYPALLLNLPTPVEAHKTFDKKIFLKSGDIGQMLQVFKKEKERDLMKARICKTPYGDYAPSGLTAPTEDIVKRRFELTRINEDTFLPYKIRQITEEITNLSTAVTNPTQSAESKVVVAKGSKKAAKEQAKKEKEQQEQEAKQQSEPKKIEKITEEVVPFEEWMVDPNNPTKGRTLVIDGLNWSSPDALLLLQHPELLYTEEDREEDEVEQLAAQQLRNKAAKQGSHKEPNVHIQHITLGNTGSSSQLNTLDVREGVERDENESAMIGGETRMKLSLTIRRTSTEGEAEGTGEEKYAIEDAPDMEVDDAAMVADDEVMEDQEGDDESDEDDNLESLLLQRVQQKSENDGKDLMALATEEGETNLPPSNETDFITRSKYEVDDNEEEEARIGLVMDQEESVINIQPVAEAGQLAAGDESEEEEDWMKGV